MDTDSAQSNGRPSTRNGRLLLDAKRRNDTELINLIQLLWELRKKDKDYRGSNTSCSGETSMRIVKMLRWLGRYDFAARGGEQGEAFAVTKPKDVARLFMDASIYGDKISQLAEQLLIKWNSGNFKPGPLIIETEELITDSDSEYVSDEDLPNVQVAPAPSSSLNQLIEHMMRGLQDGASSGGGHSLRIIASQKKDYNIFGHNGFKVGDWWPYQVCLVRDGVHGRTQGGIAGTVQYGAFSVILSGALYHNQNTDYGDTILYSGSLGSDRDENPDGVREPQGTKALLTSLRSSQPVRVIRGKGTSIYAPSAGFRYDGLYDVVGSSVIRGNGNAKLWQFKLVRCPGQDPIDTNRPTPRELRALAVIQERRRRN